MAESAFRFENLVSGVCLDLACGTGISTEAAVSVVHDAEWFAVDQCSEMLAVAEAKPGLRKVDFVQASAESLPFPDKTFDWVLCNIAYHWLPPAACVEMHRVLRPDGRLSLMVPLVAPAGGKSGNDWLAAVLMRFSRTVSSRRSQGLTLPQLRLELSDFQIEREEIVDIDEQFPSKHALLEALVSRSSMAAIFGDHADDVSRILEREERSEEGELCFRWKIGFIEARRK